MTTDKIYNKGGTVYHKSLPCLRCKSRLKLVSETNGLSTWTCSEKDHQGGQTLWTDYDLYRAYDWHP